MTRIEHLEKALREISHLVDGPVQVTIEHNPQLLSEYQKYIEENFFVVGQPVPHEKVSRIQYPSTHKLEVIFKSTNNEQDK